MYYHKVVNIETTIEEDTHLEAVLKMLAELRDNTELDEELQYAAGSAFNGILEVMDYLNRE